MSLSENYKHMPNRSIDSAYAWVVWAIATAYLLFQFFSQFAAGLMLEQWQHDFSLNATHAGLLTASYYYVYVALQTPAGFLVDRFGARSLLSLGACVCAVGCWVMSQAHSFVGAEVGRLFMGSGLSFAFVGMVYLTGRWFSLRRFTFMISLTEMIAMLGTLSFEALSAPMISQQGWRSFTRANGWVALVLAAVVLIWVRNQPDAELSDQAATAQPNVSVLLSQTKTILRDRRILALGAYAGFMFAVVTVFAAVWAEPFFMAAYHWSMGRAAALSSILMLGIVVACPVIGWLAGRVHYTKSYLAGAALLAGGLMFILLAWTGLPYGVVACVMFLLGFASSLYILTVGLANRLVPESSRSVCMGVINTLSMVTAPVLQPLVGWGLDRFDGGIVGQQYSVQAYQLSLLVIPLGLLLAAWLAKTSPSISLRD